MGKVSRQMAGLNLSGAPAAARHNVQVKHSKPDYKIQVEQITQKKKKLLSMTTYRVQAPPGYTFIPLASHELTDKCKDLSRQDGVQVHVVSTSRGGKNSTELSRQVGRVGHHFPSSVVARALNELGYDIDRSGRILNDLQRMSKGVGNEASRKDQKGTRIGEGITNRAELKKIQDKLNDEARASLTTLFPRMPNRDKKDVVKHAFAIGKDRIGSSAELSIDRRVHLAVLAHIRHTYTDYDKLLKEVPYQTARSIVEQKTLQKIIEWRGEGDNDDDVEEILREVIVIDDDDDEPVSPGLLDVADNDNEEIKFRTSPIAADKIDSRPYVAVRSPSSRTYPVPASDNPYHASEEQGRYVRVIDPERRRRHDDRVRHIWQEAKRTYREAVPISSTAYIPASSERTAELPYSRAEVYTTQRHYQEEPYWDRPQERVVSVASKPQMVMLSQPKVGVSHDAVSAYDMEPIRRGPQASQRRTPEYREVVHQSIERPANEPKTSVYREVIVLDSPPAEKPRFINASQAIVRSGDRRNTAGTLEPAHNQHATAAATSTHANGGYSLRKRTFDELDSIGPNASQVRYSNKIVHLSSNADLRPALVSDKNTYAAQPAGHVAPVQSHHSPRRYDAGLVSDAVSRRVSNSMHFYQDNRAPPPRHIYQAGPDSHVHGERVSYVRTHPQGQEVYASDGHHMSRTSSAYDHNFSVRQDAVQGPSYPVYEHDQRRNTVPSIHTYEAHYPTSYQFGRPDILPSTGMPPPNGGSGFHQQYRAERPGDEGVHRHLQRLHFYEPPRAATTTAPKRFYDEQGREVIVVEKR